ncbi:MAG TPA: phosphohistidine phosphatase SixA [Polyangia bacterium]|jgi:phosphohistidine phosphatase|nr:phosphohistidine phosphatase SixA [Polyangia bacterium]
MRVTLIRHAEAGDDAPRDEDRALTARGREDARRLGQALARRGVEFSLLVTSPLVRAVQTAEIVASEIRYRDRIAVTELLVPEGTASQVVAFLKSTERQLEESPSIALVAHEPILSAVAAALIGKPRHPPLRKTEALRIRLGQTPDGKGVLRWRVDARGRREQL